VSRDFASLHHISCCAAVDLTRTLLVLAVMLRFYLISVWASVQWICRVQCIGCYLKECAFHWRLMINDSFDEPVIAIRARRNVYTFFGSYSRVTR